MFYDNNENNNNNEKDKREIKGYKLTQNLMRWYSKNNIMCKQKLELIFENQKHRQLSRIHNKNINKIGNENGTTTIQRTFIIS